METVKPKSGFAFVSYAHANAEVVVEILRILAPRRPIWYDAEINVSATWSDEIARAIMDCDALIAFISKESLDSRFVRTEIEFAIAKKKPIVPVYLESAAILPPGLAMALHTTQGVMREGKTAKEIAEKIEGGLDFALSGDESFLFKSAADFNEAMRTKRRRIIKALIAIAAFCLVGFGAAIGIDRTLKNYGDYKITTASEEYLPNERIDFSIARVSPETVAENAVAGLWAKGEPSRINSAFSFALIEPSKELFLRAPSEKGEYEIRAFTLPQSISAYVGESAYDASPSVKTVKRISVIAAKDAFDISAAKQEYKVGETVKILLSGVDQKLFNKELQNAPLIVVYKNGDSIERTLLKPNEKELNLFAPEGEGDYEIRAYINDYRLNDSSLVKALKIKVVK